MSTKKDITNTLSQKLKDTYIEFNNVTFHIGRWVGNFEFVTKCNRGWVGV